MSLHGKVAVVTGAASGIGAASAALFLQRGAKVVLADRDADALRAVTEACGEGAVAAPCDVSKASDVESLVATAVTRFGRLDIMFNNAGIGGRALVHEMDEAMFDAVIGVNLRGAWLGSKYALRQYHAQNEGGVILNTASVSAMLGVAEQAAYAPSKAGVCALSRVISAENAHLGIRSNAICPGPVATPIMRDAENRPLDLERIRRKIETQPAVNRMALPEEVAAVAAFLASDEARMISGASIVIDGGMSVTQARRAPKRES